MDTKTFQALTWGFIRVIFLEVPLGLLFCWCFFGFAGVKIHTYHKHKRQQNLAGVTPENTVTRKKGGVVVGRKYYIQIN